MKHNNKTPLRYPGGKSILTGLFESFFIENDLEPAYYIEPYCGGAGAAINLLLSNKAQRIYLNDANYSIYSFWQSLTAYGEDFIKLFDQTPISLAEWRNQKEILSGFHNKSYSKADIISNGFATFYLNRCNRSGILNAGPIGGQSDEGQESATYKIDARYNKVDLRNRLIQICKFKSKIFVSNLDALQFLDHLRLILTLPEQRNSLVYLDPPYYKQGSSLYLNYYKHEDHQDISQYLRQEFEWKWILSYDNVKEIKDLYTGFPQYGFYINYSAQEAKLGSELLIHSPQSTLPQSLVIKEVASSGKKIELVAI